MAERFRRIVLISRPDGLPVPGNFAIETAPVPEPGNGQILVRNDTLGLAPSARIRMSEITAKGSYDPPTPLGGVVHGQSLGTVIQSRHPDFEPGDRVVLTAGGWQEISVSDATLARRIEPGLAAETCWLGALGVSGFTAYAGLIGVGAVAATDTVVVSAASGAVGSMAAQIARAKGARVIGIAGGAAKCAYLRDDLRLDGAVDYKAADFDDALAAACGGGVDLYFDNVGGRVRDAVLGRMARHGRIVLCGLLAEYNDLSGAAGPSWLPILTRELRVQGFLMRSWQHLYADFVRDVSGWIASGAVRIREDITDGLENTPDAFIRMLSGKNFGKSVVRL